MKEESEQKSLPASEKKLRDARRKGQVSRSRDFVGGAVLSVIFGYLLLAWPMLRDQLRQLIEIISVSATQPFDQTLTPTLRFAVDIFMTISLTTVVFVTVAAVVAGMAATLGPVFSFEPVKPKFDNISPTQGLKRIASLRNVVEFAKSTLKVAILAAAFWIVLRASIQLLFEIPVCGMNCLAAVTMTALRPLVATAVVAFVAIGLLDLLVQRRLFLRDMRMTRTESKREHKDLEGDPLIRRERRRMQGQFATRRVRVGLRNAVVAVTHEKLIVGLRYRVGETAVPIVVAKGRGDAGVRMCAEARRLGIPIVENAAFVSALAERHVVGDMVADDLFQMAAEALVAAGVS
jgi:type III secretion protein U